LIDSSLTTVDIKLNLLVPNLSLLLFIIKTNKTKYMIMKRPLPEFISVAGPPPQVEKASENSFAEIPDNF
jgi:hypothetical protein